jgi:hypothetical protein
MAFTFTIGRKRKSRYFIIFFGLKNVPVPPGEEKPGASAPIKAVIPLQQKREANGSEMHYSWLSIKLDPDPQTTKATPHLGLKQALSIIEKNNPDYNFITLTNLKELSEKDFTDWQNG